jgi:hypothetical protein
VAGCFVCFPRVLLVDATARDHPRGAGLDAGTLSSVLWEGRELGDALRAGDVRLPGDQRAAERFARLFPGPEPLAALEVT